MARCTKSDRRGPYSRKCSPLCAAFVGSTTFRLPLSSERRSLSLFVLSGFLIFEEVFSFSFLSFNYTVQSGILSSGDVAGWLQVGGGSTLTELGVCLYRTSSVFFLAALQVLCTSVVTVFAHLTFQLSLLSCQLTRGDSRLADRCPLLQWPRRPIAPLKWEKAIFYPCPG